MSVTELTALAARWLEAAESRSQYGGEDATSGALRACAHELREVLDNLGMADDVSDSDGMGRGFVSVAELAAWIGGVSESTVRRWLRAGKFNGAWQLDNGEWRIPRTAGLEYVERRRNGSSGAGQSRERSRRYDRREFIRRFRSKEAV